MEELRMLAMASYQSSSEHIQRRALNFFNAMDHDGDKKIDKREFLEFMQAEGHTRMANTQFFQQLDLDRNGTLGFDEVMMIYYVIQRGRPFCNLCNRFITSTYFTCVACLEDPDRRPYYLCVSCYVHQKFNHLHNGSSRFVDNYSLVEYMTKSKLCELRSRPNASLAVQRNPNSGNNQPPPVQNPQTVYNYTSIQNFYYHSHNSSTHHVHRPSASNAVINAQPQRRR